MRRLPDRLLYIAAIVAVGVAVISVLSVFERGDQKDAQNMLANQHSQAEYREHVDGVFRWLVTSVQTIADHGHVTLTTQPTFPPLPPTYGKPSTQP